MSAKDHKSEASAPGDSESALITIQSISWESSGKAESHKFLTEIFIGKDKKTTEASPKTKSPSWDRPMYFNGDASSSLKISLFAKRLIGDPVLVGDFESTVDELLKGETDGVAHGEIKTTSSFHDAHYSVKFSLSLALPEAKPQSKEQPLQGSMSSAAKLQMEESVKVAEESAGGMHRMIKTTGAMGDAMEKVSQAQEFLSSAEEMWEPLLDKIQGFTDLMDQISEVHPYAKLAWSAISMIPKALIAQNARDGNVVALVEVLNENYTLLQELDVVDLGSRKPVIIGQMSQTTTECAYFIRSYTKEKSFFTRLLTNAGSSADKKVEGFKSKFSELRESWQGHSALQTQASVLRVLTIVQDISEAQDLSDIPYVGGAGYKPEAGCLPGTRQAIIDKILDWTNAVDDPTNTLWLNGVAGCGKSAIANTVAEYFSVNKRLGSSFCFNANEHKLDRLPERVFSNIAVDLADLDADYKRSLVQGLEGKRALRNTDSIPTQVNAFLLQNSESFQLVGPIVIVIDALDECVPGPQRRNLLKTLATDVQKLPAGFRIIVTSRAEADIVEALGNAQHVRRMALDAVDTNQTMADIEQFVKHSLTEYAESFTEYPDGAWAKLLTKKSEGLFQWASTACLYISSGDTGFPPEEKLEQMLTTGAEADSGEDPQAKLDQLYNDILRRFLLPGKSTTLLDRFKAVVGTLLAAKAPLSISALQHLCPKVKANAMTALLRPLGSLFTGTADLNTAVKPLHTSLRDFLLDPERSKDLCVAGTQWENDLALSCLQVMTDQLHFNMCELETSHVLNSEVKEIETKKTEKISEELSYSASYWWDHAEHANPSDTISPAVGKFIEEQLLYWLEAMALKGKLNAASVTLLSIAGWSKDSKISTLALDARKLIATFGNVITLSTPHLYISALPFAPADSSFRQLYLPKVPSTLQLRSGLVDKWPSIQYIIKGAGVSTIGFSPDDKILVARTAEGFARSWDAESAQEVVNESFHGREHEANNFAFSFDGTKIVAVSDVSMLQVWNADSGIIAVAPFSCDEGYVDTVAFSRDGKKMLARAYSNIHVFDAESGTPIGAPFEQAPDATTISFSADSENVVMLAVNSKEIRRRNLKSGAETVQTLQGGEDFNLTTADLSPDGKKMVTGSYEGTVHVWDVESGTISVTVSEVHDGSVNLVLFSKDGKEVLSASQDQTVSVWDAVSGTRVAGPFLIEEGGVSGAALSGDGKRIAAFSLDGTIYVWNRELVDTAAGVNKDFPQFGPYSIAYSSDGSKIVGGMEDGSVRVWDAATGELRYNPEHSHTEPVIFLSLSGNKLTAVDQEYGIAIWDLESGEEKPDPIEQDPDNPDPEVAPFYPLSFSAEGDKIVTGSPDGAFRVWNSETGALIAGPHKIRDEDESITYIGLTKDGSKVISLIGQRIVKVWDTQTGALIGKPVEAQEAFSVLRVTWSEDGKLILVGLDDGNFELWNPETGTQVGGPFKQENANVCGVAFSTDGSVVAGAWDRSVGVWDADSGAVKIGPLNGHADQIGSIALSPDGKQIVSGGYDKTIRVWSVSPPSDAKDSKGFTYDCKMDDDGWVRNPAKELLFWLPPWYRRRIIWPNNVLLISKEMPAELDLSRWVHGFDWKRCQDSA